MGRKLTELDVATIHSAFSPAREIQDPRLFVGRRDEVAAGIRSLLNPGGFLAIFGLRGVGKSSIAYQLKLLSEGSTALVDSLRLQRSMPRGSFNYLVHYIRCDSFVANVHNLVLRILFGDESNLSLFSLTKAGERRLQQFKRTVAAEGHGGFFGARVGARGQQESTYETFISDDLIQQFRALLGTIRRDNPTKSGLLIIIDEFDRVVDKSGFASIVKAFSSDPFVKFGVVGIGSSVVELIHDHESIGRQIDLVRVPLMPRSDLVGILRRAEDVVSKAIRFDAAASEELAGRAEGYPFFVHLLGREAMLRAHERGSAIVQETDIKYVAELVSEGRLRTIYEDLYHEAVKHSTQREVLLKIFAETDDDEISTEPVYGLAREMGITNPSQLMKELTAPEKPDAVLVKVRSRYYRFKDPVFKVYARLRQWKY